LDDDSTATMSADDRAFQHRPVMVSEIVDVFATVPPGVVLDATLGGGGHSEALLESRADLQVLGIDRDPSALAAAGRRLARFGDRVTTVHARFDDLDHAMQILRSHDDSRGIPRHPAVRSDDTLGIPRHPASGPGGVRLSGALFDLGVSSPQLDRAERGFSYRDEGPLDMRMDTTAAWSASDVVNGYATDDLARVLRRYGDERFAARIARAIVAARPIETTTALAAVVTAAIPAAARRTGGHPAKRTFQAIRIEVNGELDALPGAIDAAIEATAPGGRIAVLSYHSGEDRIVKERFRRATGACDCPPGLPCVCGAVQTVRLVRRVAKRPSAEEVETNPRASSARLRVAERLEDTP
jgi:16S rRNA (cytosine1402-N4)-methyltransferase